MSSPPPDGTQPLPARAGWALRPTPPGQHADPSELPAGGWRPAIVPGTVAQALDTPLDNREDLEARDWWYRCRFDAPGPLDAPWRLGFAGLATLAEVWLNGERVLETRNMFRSWQIPAALQASNELAICFRSLTAACKARRPRPRWRTALVEQQRLRFFRTSLLGRAPGWTPRTPAIGPWRAITLGPPPPVEGLALCAGVSGGAPRLRLRARAGAGLQRARLRVGDQTHPIALRPDGDGLALAADLRLPDAPLWWPHTHGEPALLDCALLLTGPDGIERAMSCGRVGFRELSIDRAGGAVRLLVNGRAVFCRGACWTADDPRSLDGPPEQTAETLRRARDGGLNMLRIGGTMTYGSDALYDACDALGILVWQDLMFANMDYPLDDPDFRAEVDAELTQQLRRLSARPCVAVYCGGSEIAQQAAMVGLPAEQRGLPFFEQDLPALIDAEHPGVPYFPSTPWGGPLPFHTDAGLTHYYGVGAYRRPLADARASRVRFTPECLGFSNVPDGDHHPPPHHPDWKAGVPRDAGAGWDFEDVRDHYLAALFGVDPVALRSVDPERYLALSRAVTGELMRRVFAEWRRPDSGCGGGLVWFLKDLRPGAGWGLLDSEGRPKAAYRALRRAWARRAVAITDEGLNGLGLHLINEHPEPLTGAVELTLLRDGRDVVRAASAPVALPAWGAETRSADALLDGFADLAHAYRFGPPAHDVAIARLRGADGAALSEDAVFPGGWGLPMQRDPGLRGAAERSGAQTIVTLQADAFLQWVSVECRGWLPEDDHFHLCPGAPRTLRFVAGPSARSFKARFTALNTGVALTVRA